MANYWKGLVCCKIFERIRGGNEKKKEVNWPELVTYCGCCTLSTGIFITSIITLIANLVCIAIMGDTFRRIIILKSMAKDGFVSTQDESLIIMFTYMEIELEKNPKIYEALIAFYIFWFTYKTIYVLALIFTLPALFKNT
nr:uncharacterized protein LOC116770918 [Danaus plexippus plexippus]